MDKWIAGPIIGVVDPDTEDWSYKTCRCNSCGIVEVCTPITDFYVVNGKGGKLYCERCYQGVFAGNLKDSLKGEQADDKR